MQRLNDGGLAGFVFTYQAGAIADLYRAGIYDVSEEPHMK
jgi:hypothetical protein